MQRSPGAARLLWWATALVEQTREMGEVRGGEDVGEQIITEFSRATGGGGRVRDPRAQDAKHLCALGVNGGGTGFFLARTQRDQGDTEAADGDRWR